MSTQDMQGYGEYIAWKEREANALRMQMCALETYRWLDSDHKYRDSCDFYRTTLARRLDVALMVD